MDEMWWFLVGMGSCLLTCLGFGSYNNIADNRSVETLVAKGVPALEAMCAIRPQKELCIGVMVKQ